MWFSPGLKHPVITATDWARSTQLSLYVRPVRERVVGRPGYLSASSVRFVSGAEGAAPIETPTLAQLDSVFAPARSLTLYPHFCTTPLTLEPGLDSFCWPLSTSQFLNEYYQRKALVVHATGQRLEQLEKDLHAFVVEDMIADASRLTVWMKTQQGQMQYLEAGPDIALNCFRAGHSLYFNPSTEVQTKYISALAADLLHDFGAEKDGGIGGDLEIFAVQGRHATPWHFDAQENFTVLFMDMSSRVSFPPYSILVFRYSFVDASAGPSHPAASRIPSPTYTPAPPTAPPCWQTSKYTPATPI